MVTGRLATLRLIRARAGAGIEWGQSLFSGPQRPFDAGARKSDCLLARDGEPVPKTVMLATVGYERRQAA
jgi:hypothetical protein